MGDEKAKSEWAKTGSLDRYLQENIYAGSNSRNPGISLDDLRLYFEITEGLGFGP